MEAACKALGVSKSGFYRYRHPKQPTTATSTHTPRPSPPRALKAAERQHILDLLYSPRFQDLAVPQVFYNLLDDSTYLCSIRTMYRLLQTDQASRERRNQRRLPRYEKPELLATGINQVWTWDITKLRSPTPGLYYHLYVLLDLFSRLVVGWRVAERESSQYAQELIAMSCERQKVGRGELTLHSDRGPSMTSQTVDALLVQLDVEKSLSRPYTPNDNAYSESQFRTMKYRPNYPQRFGSLEDARAWCRQFFVWYNQDHRHSGIRYLTPWEVHSGQGEQVLSRRHEVMRQAYEAHPERFVEGAPALVELPEAVWLNRPEEVARALPNTFLPKGGPVGEVLTARQGPRPPASS